MGYSEAEANAYYVAVARTSTKTVIYWDQDDTPPGLVNWFNRELRAKLAEHGYTKAQYNARLKRWEAPLEDSYMLYWHIVKWVARYCYASKGLFDYWDAVGDNAAAHISAKETQK